MTWYLILFVYGCNNNQGIDPGMIPGNCYNHEQRVPMPSLEICRQVRAINNGSKCIIEDVDH
jgi:hypothetical protein